MSLLTRRAMMGIAELPKASWIDGDISTIKQMLDDAQAGKAVDFSNWHIGDARPVIINSQSCNLVLAHRFTGTPENDASPYAFNGTAKYPTWAVLCTPQMEWSTKYMNVNIPQKYFSGTLRGIISVYEDDLQEIPEGELFKKFICVVGQENTTTGKISGTYSRSQYLSALAIKEVGINNPWNDDENAALVRFDYFDSDSKRKIAGEENYWLRSPAKVSGTSYMACKVNSSTGGIATYAVNNSCGVVWFGCI